MLPDGTISYTFKDIPKWARAAKEHGINAVQISGWQRGGHDNGYPYYEPDPRLGTWKELEEGIRACHKMGLKVYFFANYQPMMVDSDWYKNELSKYRETKADGGYTWMAGWGMGTLWARAGHPKLMTWANLAFPQFRKIIVDYFVKLASIGADGVHVDKMFPTAIDYNPDSPMSPDTGTWEGAIQLTQEIMRECRKANPSWCMSFECNWDRMLQFGGATWWVGNQLITRKVFPENTETLGLYQAYDYLGVNNAVREGHAVMLAPLNFSRSLDWPPFRGLADYIKEVKQIRDALQDAVFFGESLGQSPVKLQGGPPDGVAYNVFRNRTDGRRVCVLTNSRIEERKLSFPAFEEAPGGKARIHTPNRKPRVVTLPAEMTIPAERVVFVEELGGGR
jgi:glycosidase